MPPLEVFIAAILMVSLTLYALLGGADYGGGVWDMLARGPRAKAQRALIAKAISPIWEANHVWLILVVTVLFTCFPPVFARVSTVLHIPLTVMLVGIVLRGSAFTFRAYDFREEPEDGQRHWGRIFAMASVITPLMLGITVGAISSGQVRPPGADFVSSFVRPWLAVFPFTVGVLTLAIFSLLAATYLTVEANDSELKNDFRLRALAAWIISLLLAMAALALARRHAPLIFSELTGRPWSWPLLIVTALCALSGFMALWRRYFALARLMVAAQVSLILWGWGLAQFPYLVEPDLTVFGSAAPKITLHLVFWSLVIGAFILFPSFFYLFKIFKGSVLSKPPTEQAESE